MCFKHNLEFFPKFILSINKLPSFEMFNAVAKRQGMQEGEQLPWKLLISYSL